MIGIGLFYRRGYFRQRLDLAGRQQEYWLDQRPEEPADGARLGARRARRCSSTVAGRRPADRASRSGGSTSAACRCSCSTPSCPRTTRCSAGRRRGSTRATAPCGSASTALLGIGGARVLDALGIEPARHPPERGPPGARAARARDPARSSAATPLEEALDAVRAGAPSSRPTPRRRPGTRPTRRRSSCAAFGDLADRLGIDDERVPRSLPRRSRRRRRAAGDDAARDPDEPPPKRRQPAPRRGRARDVAADVPRLRRRDVPITHVTNGAHLRELRRRRRCARCSRRRLGDAGSSAPADPAVWEARARDPERGALGGALRGARASSSATSAQRSQVERLQRGEQIDYVTRDRDRPRPGRAHARLRPPLRDLQARLPADARPRARARDPLGRAAGAAARVAGKAHPNDEAGKDVLQRLYAFKRAEPEIAEPGRDRRGLRPRRRRAPRLRLRRLGQPAAPADGGERHERHEGDLQRRAPAERPRRLVGRGLRRRRTAGRSPARRTATPSVVDAPRRRSASTTCSSTR